MNDHFWTRFVALDEVNDELLFVDILEISSNDPVVPNISSNRVEQKGETIVNVHLVVVVRYNRYIIANQNPYKSIKIQDLL